jgi:hypothetical protein
MHSSTQTESNQDAALAVMAFFTSWQLHQKEVL